MGLALTVPYNGGFTTVSLAHGETLSTMFNDVYPIPTTYTHRGVLHWNSLIEACLAQVVEHRGVARRPLGRRAGPHRRRRRVRALLRRFGAPRGCSPRRRRRRLHRESRARGRLHAHLPVRVAGVGRDVLQDGSVHPGFVRFQLVRSGRDSRRLRHGVGGGG